MAKVLRVLSAALGVLGGVLALGLVAFAGLVQTTWPVDVPSADGIVVLTGGDERITAGLEQLAEGRGRRLLISGVNPSNKSTEDLSRWLGEVLPACCIDLGYRAQNTIGNADEARDWARTWGYRSLLVVTSDFHMARSMTEFRRAMPGIKLIAHPVASRYAQPQWWASRSSAQMLAAEYMKFLASKVRLGASRMVGAFDNLMFAEREVLPVPRSGRSRRDS